MKQQIPPEKGGEMEEKKGLGAPMKKSEASNRNMLIH